MASGGQRAGAGRPAKNYITLSVRVPQEDITLIRSVAADLGISQGEVVHEMIKTYRENAEEGR